MSKTRDIIARAFTPGDRGLIERYRGREIEFFRERGRLYPEKLEEIFWAVAQGTYSDLVIIGPRGGGKTMGVYDGATTRFAWHDDDVFAIGGSEAQARNGYAYTRQILASESGISDGLQDELKTCATGPLGNWFKVAASSSKQVRGPHPGDPHQEMGWKSHGGVLIKDERDEMDDEISDAADFSMGAARPGMIITTSTMHREDGGGIAQLAEEAEARGAHVIKFDIFDVSEVCQHDCAACPGGAAFAGPLYGFGENENAQRKDAKGAKNKEENDGEKRTDRNVYPTKESLAGWEKYKRENAWPVDEPAYCEGRSKQHAPGHMPMADIFQFYKRSRNKEIFEVEFCCRKRRGARRVVDGAALDRCLASDVFFEPQYEAPVITIDWGFVGWTVLILVQRQGEHKIAVIDVRYEHMASTDALMGICREWQAATGAYKVAADGSHPFQNAELAQDGFEVTPVPFVKYKEFGAGWVRGIVERGQLRMQGEIRRGGHGIAGVAEKPEYYFESDAMKELHKQIKGWQRDKNGKIVKKNDHGPDSLSCAAVLFSENHEWEPEFESLGSRDASGWGN